MPTTTGLQEQWANEFDAWGPAISQRLDELENTPVKILVWGPGAGWNAYYDKRIQIRDHLRSAHPRNDALTSEELMNKDPRLQDVNPQDAEQIQVDLADLIILLIGNDPRITGVQTEISLYRRRQGFYEKARLLIPRLTTREKERHRSFLSQGWIDYPSEHAMRYTGVMFNNCTRIRAWCEEHAKRVREHLTYRSGNLSH